MFEKDPPLVRGRFYLVQQENYDPALHEDGIPEYDDSDRSRRIVRDRLVPILSIVDGEGFNPWGPVAQEFEINPPNEELEAGSIHIYVYRSVGHPHPAEHSPLRDATTGEILPGLESYPISFVDFTKATNCVRSRKPIKGKKRGLYVLGFLDMVKVGEGVELVVKLMSKNFRLNDQQHGHGKKF